MSEPRLGSRRVLVALFLAAFALRIGALFAFDTPALARGATPWTWGHEPACLAQAWLDGRGFSDPWGKGTGPSSWLTPPYPALIAALLAATGGLGPATATALFVLQALVSAATCVLLVVLGREVGAPRVGLLAGALFAVYPIAISNAVQLVWDTTFVAAGLTACLVLLLRVRGELASAVKAGLGYGALLLLNPAPLSLAPVAAWFVFARGGVKSLLAFGTCALAVCSPWMVRNQLVLGSASLRPNFGVEMRIGNHDQANGRPVPFRYHPSHVEVELALYRELGEVGYARDNWRRARQWIAAHPGRFATLTAKRVALFWIGESPLTDPRQQNGHSPREDPSSWIKFVAFLLVGAAGLAGLAVWRLEPRVKLLFAGASFLFGVPYYLSHVSERYRFPIDPLLVLCAAALALEIADRLSLRARAGTQARA